MSLLPSATTLDVGAFKIAVEERKKKIHNTKRPGVKTFLEHNFFAVLLVRRTGRPNWAAKATERGKQFHDVPLIILARTTVELRHSLNRLLEATNTCVRVHLLRLQPPHKTVTWLQ